MLIPRSVSLALWALVVLMYVVVIYGMAWDLGLLHR